MDAVLTKPIELNLLAQTLRQWLPHAVSEAACNAAPRLPSKTPNVQRVLNLFYELEPMLKNLQFNSIALFNELQEEVDATALAPQLERAAGALQVFQFGVALSELQAIMAKPNWKDDLHCSEGVPIT